MTFDLAAAVASPVQRPQFRLNLAWTEAEGDPELLPYRDLSKLMSSWSVTSELVGGDVDGLYYAQGVSASQLKVNFAGSATIKRDHRSALAWLSEFATDSPMYGWKRFHRPVTAAISYTDLDDPSEETQLFTGYSVDMPADRTGVSLEAIDGREKMTGEVRLPMGLRNYGDGLRLPGLNAQWVIDYVYRRCGYYASPALLPDCAAALSFHGSCLPEVGVLVEARRQTPAGNAIPLFTGGKFALALEGYPQDSPYGQRVEVELVTPNSSIKLFLDQDWTFECWAEVGSTSTLTSHGMYAPDNESFAIFYIDAGVLKLDVLRQDDEDMVTVTGPTLVGAKEWRYLRLEASLVDDTLNVDFTINDSVTSVSASAPINAPGLPILWGYTLAEESVEAWQISQTIGHPSNYPFVPNAVLEPSLNELVAIPPNASTDPWITLGEIAAAEQAAAGLNIDGTAFYWSRAHWATPEAATLQHTLTTTREVLDAAYDDGLRFVKNVITVPLVAYEVSEQKVIWSLANTDVIELPADSEQIMWVNLQDPSLDVVDSFFSNTPDPNDLSLGWYDLNTAADGSGTELSFGPVVVILESWAQSLKLQLINETENTVYMVDASGKPSLNIVGRTVTSTTLSGGEQRVQDDDSIAEYGEQAWKAPENKWRQKGGGDLNIIAENYLAQLAFPRPRLRGLKIVGRPVDRGDRFALAVKGELGIVGEFWATKLEHSGSVSAPWVTGIGAVEAL